jgi:hypothetical protein
VFFDNLPVPLSTPPRGGHRYLRSTSTADVGSRSHRRTAPQQKTERATRSLTLRGAPDDSRPLEYRWPDDQPPWPYRVSHRTQGVRNIRFTDRTVSGYTIPRDQPP